METVFSRSTSSAGLCIFGVGTAAAGILDFVWGEFERAHQPIQAWGDHIAGERILAYITALWLTAAGVAMLWRRSARAGSAASAVIYLIFALFWLPRFYTAPHVLGFRIGLLIGLTAGVFMQLILVAGAMIAYASLGTTEKSVRKAARIGRWIFGVGSLLFGLAQLVDLRPTAAMVPKWIPFGGNFWAVITGIAFMLAGIAILCRIVDVLAARLLALMLLVFSALALAPLPFAAPHNHIAWGANAYNLAAVGAVWIFAQSIAAQRTLRTDQLPATSFQLPATT